MIITYQSKLLSKRTIAPGVVLLRCSYPSDHPDWTFQAGHYMIIHVPQADNHPVRRLYSIGSPPSQKDSIDFIIEIVPGGIGGGYVESLKEGDSLTLQGAAGMFVYKTSPRPPVFLATGTGIAPIYSMIRELLTNETSSLPLRMFWGMKHCAELYLVDELIALKERHPRFDFSICVSRDTETNGLTPEQSECITSGRVTKELDKIGEELSNYDFYLCGGKMVIEGLKEYLAARGVPTSQIYFEKFT